MNVSIIFLTLKYLNKNYKSTSNISRFVNYELIKKQLESQTIAIKYRNDLRIIKTTIKFSGCKCIKIRDYNYLYNSLKVCQDNNKKFISMIIVDYLNSQSYRIFCNYLDSFQCENYHCILKLLKDSNFY